MRRMLFLGHRFPYPPNKGERIRAWTLLRHFARDWEVHFGCLSDDPADPAHDATVRPVCAEFAWFPIDKRRQKLRALAGFRPGRPLMLDYYWHQGLADWTREAMSRTRFDLAYIFSTPMAPYVLDLAREAGIPRVLDMQDVDSAKWRDYAATAGFPMRHVWAREARTLLTYERRAADACAATLLVSQPECDHLVGLAPELVGRVHAIEQGVDLDAFNPGLVFDRPFAGDAPQLVLVGNMDYWPNADAAIWFAREVLPLLRAGPAPAAEFTVVGGGAGPDVLALASLPGVRVTGRVPDVRPYVAHATVSVTPLRIARGIQNKILEAMALGRPVVTTPQGYEGVRAVAGHDLLVADGAAAMAQAVAEVIDGKHPGLGAAARRAMEAGYHWSGILARLDAVLDAATSQPATGQPVGTTQDSAP